MYKLHQISLNRNKDKRIDWIVLYLVGKQAYGCERII